MKRFIQGLGVGILLTTLIFTIAYAVIGEKELSDAQIKAKAKQLGMVEKEDSIFSTPLPQENVETGDVGAATDGAADSVMSANVNAQQNVPAEDVPVSQENINATAKQTETPVQEQNMSGTVSFTVQPGEGATKISENLQAAGLVDDAVAFDRYLRSQRYTTIILVGTYELRPDMSYEELATVLMGR